MADSSKSAAPLLLVFGEDEFAVRQRARQVYQQWTAEIGGQDHEILDAAVSNSGEALGILSRLREALQTLPFFGGGKVVWLQNCSFLGEDRTASAQAVTEALAELAADLKSFSWDQTRLLISAGKVDKRKVLYKAIDKIGAVEQFAGWSVDDRDWAAQAEQWADKAIRARRKEIGDDALAELVSRVGPNSRQLENEVEKLCLFIGGRTRIESSDIAEICTRNKNARAFALGDALGDRDLPRLLARLDEELWAMQFDSQKSEIGLLYGLISKVRALLLLKEMLREGWVKPDSDYTRFKSQLDRVPADRLPADRRFNPLTLNPYVLYKALPQVKKYGQSELVRAMDLLLECNRRLVSSGLEESLVLQQALIRIAAPAEPAAGPGRAAARAAE
ncbi:MAG: DNA polymerase III subunit delta [Verrucomicrobiota bacterium]